MGENSILAKPKSLTVEPEVIFFKTLGGEADLTVSNPGNTRQAVKARCSNNAAYKIVPSGFFLESGEAKTVHIKRVANQQARTDKIIFCSVNCGADAKDVKSIVSAAGAKTFNARVMLKIERDNTEKQKKEDVGPKPSNEKVTVEDVPSVEPSA